MPSIVGIQGYVFHQIYAEQEKNPNEHLDEILQQVKSCGVEAYEQGIPSNEVAADLARYLKEHDVKMPSMYAGAALHTPEWKTGVDLIVERAARGLKLGARVVVVNPDPIAWGKPFDKTDEQLSLQAKALQALGEKLMAAGQMLAYHTHDPEMRCAAREFHHMLQSTDPKVVKFCLDTHWVYRGAQNSQIALYDIVKMYLPRISSLHIRQSRNGIWTETLCDGDIDYRPLVNILKQANFAGPIIMEQCREEGTPRTLSPVEAIKQSRQWVRQIFGC